MYKMITTGRTGAMTTIALFLCEMAPLFNSVYGATCTSNTCVASMFTLATCSATTHLCSCEAGHVPVRTGCGKKYSKPKVILPDGYSFEVLEGKNAELKCSTDAPFVDWYYDNGTFVTTGTTYTLASASAANVGKIKCKGKLEKTDSALDSDFSDAQDIKLIKKTGEITETPIFKATPQMLFANKRATFHCTNIPMGYDMTKIKYTYSGAAVENMADSLTMTSSLKDKKVKCILTDMSAHSTAKESVESSLPKLTNTIESVTVMPSVDSVTYSTNEPVKLTCLTEPGQEFVDNEITYQWMNNKDVVPNQSSASYTLPETAGNYNIRCAANYGHKLTESNNVIHIIRSSTYVIKPIIEANPAAPVLGNQLTLACGSKYNDGLYTWKIGTVDIARQFDHTLQLDNLTTIDAGSYQCSVTRSKVTMSSDVFNVTFNTIKNGHVIAIGSALVTGLMLLASRLFV